MRIWMSLIVGMVVIADSALIGVRAEEKISEFAKDYGFKRFVACLRTEAAQNQPAPKHADQFGFNPPVVAEMKERHGIDILTDPRFDYTNPKFNVTDPMRTIQVLPSGPTGQLHVSPRQGPGFALHSTQIWAKRQFSMQYTTWPLALEIRSDPPTGMMAEELRCFCRVVRGLQPSPPPERLLPTPCGSSAGWRNSAIALGDPDIFAVKLDLASGMRQLARTCDFRFMNRRNGLCYWVDAAPLARQWIVCACGCRYDFAA